jgi:tRNA modification GTPase
MARTPGDDTIFALSSGQPPAAVAIVRTSGPSAFAAAEAIAGPLPPARQVGLRALHDPLSGTLIDRALVVTFAAPASATGEDTVEYQCHGGRAVTRALLDALAAQPGMRLATPGEFTRRALANGRIDLTEAEGLADLLAAETELQRRVALERTEGGLRTQLENWRGRLLDLAAAAEVAIDYPDEEEGAVAPLLAQPARELAEAMAGLLAQPPLERLREGLRIVVAGPPNAGKSSLVNALARSERALVTPIAGTTRDTIEVPLAMGDLPVVLVDSAGLRSSDDVIEQLGIERAHAAIAAADLVLWLGEADTQPADRPVLLVANKCDIAPRDEGIAVSALTGEGLSALTEAITATAQTLLPSPRALSLDRREALALGQSEAALRRAATLDDPLLVAEELRHAMAGLDLVSGRAGIEDMLDVLFGRFCLGK